MGDGAGRVRERGGSLPNRRRGKERGRRHGIIARHEFVRLTDRSSVNSRLLFVDGNLYSIEKFDRVLLDQHRGIPSKAYHADFLDSHR